jgi:hypothetical protein
MPNTLAENPKIAFRKEFSFQIYNSFSTKSKQNGSLLVSAINTNIGGIFEAWKISFADWSKERSFCIEPTCYVILFFGLSAEAPMYVFSVQRSCATRPHQALSDLHLT